MQGIVCRSAALLARQSVGWSNSLTLLFPSAPRLDGSRSLMAVMARRDVRLAAVAVAVMQKLLYFIGDHGKAPGHVSPARAAFNSRISVATRQVGLAGKCR